MASRRTRPAPVPATDSLAHLPNLPRVYVPRRRLWAELDAASRGAATLVVGPGGAGKTLGVAGWLRSTGRTTDTVWVRADSSWLPERLLPMLGPDRLVVVDDAHDLPAATIRALDARLDSDPESIRLLLISRWDLPFTRLSAELLGHYTVLRGELLRLDDEESTALVAAHVHADAPEVARAITSRAQGWCGAVVMTARAVAVSPDPAALARQYAEEGVGLADRVASEVFATLQPRQRHLLLCVGTEPVVTPSLAVHLTHDPRAGEVLAELEATGLLVTRLPAAEATVEGAAEHDASTEHQARYAIHPLLTEVVRRRTVAGGVDVLRAAATVRRAVRLDVDRGVTDDAFRRLVAICDHAGAAELLATTGTTLVLRGHADGMNAWALAHPSAVDVNPAVWFPIALDQWFTGSVGAARHWLDRIVNDPLPDTATSELHRVTARVMRARLGQEPIVASADLAREALERHRDGDGGDEFCSVLALLQCELAISQNWLGRLDEAAAALSAVVHASRSREIASLTCVALSHLAFTEFMSGREATAAAVADEVLTLASHRTPYSRHRALLIRDLAALSDLPTTSLGHLATPEPTLHAADPTTRFWARAGRARQELRDGSLSGAERILAAPIETPELSDHLWYALTMDRALLASLAGDPAVLADLEGHLAERGMPGGAALVAGLGTDRRGDRRGAASRFERAATLAEHPQPPVRAIALMAAAQLRSELGETDTADDLAHQAVVATEARRNALPFLGWTRHGTPASALLEQLARVRPDGWAAELLASVGDLAGIATSFGPSTAAPNERVEVPEGAIAPVLSPRERDVLYELARGSTYADIATNLFVSENTVKTHVSSLYGKLSVNRRSAALAAARSMHLL